MRRFEVYMTLDLLKDVSKTGRRRKEIMDFIYSLRDRPYTEGDYITCDEALRARQVKIMEGFAVTYWVDVPVSIVMVGIQTADRA